MLYIPWHDEDQTFPFGKDFRQEFLDNIEEISLKSATYKKEPIDWNEIFKEVAQHLHEENESSTSNHSTHDDSEK